MWRVAGMHAGQGTAARQPHAEKDPHAGRQESSTGLDPHLNLARPALRPAGSGVRRGRHPGQIDVFFNVPDLDAAMARAVSAGGRADTVLML